MLRELKEEVRQYLISKFDLASLEEKFKGGELNKFINSIIKEISK